MNRPARIRIVLLSAFVCAAVTLAETFVHELAHAFTGLVGTADVARIYNVFVTFKPDDVQAIELIGIAAAGPIMSGLVLLAGVLVWKKFTSLQARSAW